MKWCHNCLNPDTRPRITFNEEGVCNACQWSEKKKALDWSARWKKLKELCDQFRRQKGWDVIVPYSGGKDSVYVAWQLKKLKMHPLLVTFEPHLETMIGTINRERLREPFDCITITPNYEDYRTMAIDGFVEQGRPKMPFVTGISTALMQLAIKLDIPFIMYGEEGESEYGGISSQAFEPKIPFEYLLNCYYSGFDPSSYGSWWKVPNERDFNKLYATHWSHFEDWDAKVHADYAIKKGMKTAEQVGTFTDYAQLSDVLQDLHAFLMYTKFGFGRTTSDVGIEIRAGRMTREEGLKLVERLDGQFPWKVFSEYLKYFRMTEKEFFGIVKLWTNFELVERRGDRWRLKPELIRQRCGKSVILSA